MIEAPLRGAGLQTLRESLKSIVELVEKGTPVAVLQQNEVIAVMLQEDEVNRYREAEYSIATLHGMEVYPELARDTSELPELVCSATPLAPPAREEILNRRRQIVGPFMTVGISDLRQQLTMYLAEVVRGQAYTIAQSGRLVATIVHRAEYDRLRDLQRTVRWFASAGLDLTRDDSEAVEEWVRAYRASARARKAATRADEGAPGTTDTADSRIA